MKILDLLAWGTSEGVKKEWETRHGGQSKQGARNQKPAHWQGSGGKFHGFVHSTLGEAPRRYHLLQGAGPNGGQWAAYEAKSSKGARELAVYESKEEATDHINHSQLD